MRGAGEARPRSPAAAASGTGRPPRRPAPPPGLPSRTHTRALTPGLPSPPPLAQEARNLLVCVGELGAAELGEALTRYGVKAPGTGHDISPPFPFNLMFR